MFFFLVLVGTGSAILPPSIFHPATGSLGQHVGIIENTAMRWQHNWILDLKPLTLPFEQQDIELCNATATNKNLECAWKASWGTMFNAALDKLNQDYEYDRTALLNLLKAHNKQRRTRRGWINIGGKILNTVFGVATEDQIKASVEVMRKTQEMASANADHLQVMSDDLVSLCSLTEQMNATLSNELSKIYQSQRIVEITIGTQIKDFITGFNQIMDGLAQTLLETMSILNSHSILKNLLGSWSELQQSLLPPLIINQDHLSDILGKIRAVLKDTDLMADIEFDHPISHMYSEPWTNYQYHESEQLLVISLNIGILKSSSFLHVYQITTFPFMKTDNKLVKAKVPKFLLGIDDQKTRFSMIPRHELALCKGRNLKRCSRLYPEYVLNQTDSCLPSLLGLSDSFADTCKVQVIKSDESDPIVYVDHGMWFITILPGTWSLSCINQTTVEVTTCTYCTVQVPCQCELLTEYVTLPSAERACWNESESSILRPLPVPHFQIPQGEFEFDIKGLPATLVNQYSEGHETFSTLSEKIKMRASHQNRIIADIKASWSYTDIFGVSTLSETIMISTSFVFALWIVLRGIVVVVTAKKKLAMLVFLLTGLPQNEATRIVFRGTDNSLPTHRPPIIIGDGSLLTLDTVLIIMLVLMTFIYYMIKIIFLARATVITFYRMRLRSWVASDTGFFNKRGVLLIGRFCIQINYSKGPTTYETIDIAMDEIPPFKGRASMASSYQYVLDRAEIRQDGLSLAFRIDDQCPDIYVSTFDSPYRIPRFGSVPVVLICARLGINVNKVKKIRGMSGCTIRLIDRQMKEVPIFEDGASMASAPTLLHPDLSQMRANYEIP